MSLRRSRMHRALFLALACWGFNALAQETGRPTAAVVLLGEGALTGKEVQLLLQTSIDEMRRASGYELDPVLSLQAGSDASTQGCALEYECLLRVSSSTEVDAILAVQATPEGKRSLQLEFLWVAADARGVPGESQKKIARTPAALEASARAGVQKIIPTYARKGRGGLTVLAEAGSDIQIDGQRVGKAPMDAPVILSAGVHRVDILTPGGARVSRSVEVLEARRQVADLPSPAEAVASLTRKEEAHGGKTLRTASWVVGGAGVLALAGGVYFGVDARNMDRQLREGACSQTPCTQGLTQRDAQQLYDTANGRATLGNVGVTTGALMLVSAGVMYWLSNQEEAQ